MSICSQSIGRRPLWVRLQLVPLSDKNELSLVRMVLGCSRSPRVVREAVDLLTLNCGFRIAERH